MQDQVISQNGKKSPWLMFILPSLLGVFLFMAPISYQDSLTIPIAILAKSVQSLFDGMLPAIVTFVIALTGIASIATKLLKPKAVLASSFLSGLLNPSLPWFVVQQLGAIFVVMTYFGIGPEMIHHGDTGGLVLNDLLPVLFSVFLFAGLLLPLLLNFGLLEFVGALFTRVMRPLFNLPGRSAVNCIASWLGDGSVGVLMTSKQYESKIYTEREAAVIGTTFTAVSITFSLVVIAQVNLEHMFAPFYLTVCLAGLAAAVIVPRLPPLSWKKDRYIDGQPLEGDIEALPEGKTVVGFGLEQALEKASQVKSLRSMVAEGC